MTSIRDRSQTLDELLAWRDGVLDCGSVLARMTPDALRWRLKSGRWQQPCRGVIVAQSGPLSKTQMLRVAALWAGSGSALGGLTAAKLYGFHGFDDKDDQIHVVLPAGRAKRKTRPPLQLIVHYSTRLTSADVHPGRQPPRTRVARSLVDAAAWMPTDRGARAVLRQAPRLDGQGRRRWLDVCWESARLVVEIDGAAHTDVLQYWDDMDRDNDLTLNHHRVLRFPAWVVRYRPAYVAVQINQALREAGP
jgi:Protein of unknown function (DUF559)